MKTVLVSMRADLIQERNELRDSIDTRLIDFLQACGLNALPIPNRLASAKQIFAMLQPEGVILCGGSDHPTREEVERFLVNQSIQSGISIFGICHGMQFLVSHFGGEVSPTEGHVGRRHRLLDSKKSRLREVNSFHQLGVVRLPKNWQSLAHSEDGTVEWTVSPAQKIQAIMWHPERESDFAPEDIRIFREHFKT